MEELENQMSEKYGENDIVSCEDTSEYLYRAYIQDLIDFDDSKTSKEFNFHELKSHLENLKRNKNLLSEKFIDQMDKNIEMQSDSNEDSFEKHFKSAKASLDAYFEFLTLKNKKLNNNTNKSSTKYLKLKSSITLVSFGFLIFILYIFCEIRCIPF